MSSNTIIALSGVNGTGKTTLATKLAEVMGPNVNLITYSRPTAAAKSLGYNSSRDVPGDDKSQWEFQVVALFEQIKAQQNFGQNNTNIIDRTTLDYLSFLNYKLPHIKGTEKHDLYEQIVLEFSKEYNHIFLCPSFGTIEDNGIRLLIEQDPIQKELLNLYKKHNINYHHIKAITLDTRLTEVLDVLGIR